MSKAIVISVTGLGYSGKSTLARRLGKLFPGAMVVESDGLATARQFKERLAAAKRASGVVICAGYWPEAVCRPALALRISERPRISGFGLPGTSPAEYQCRIRLRGTAKARCNGLKGGGSHPGEKPGPMRAGEHPRKTGTTPKCSAGSRTGRREAEVRQPRGPSGKGSVGSCRGDTRPARAAQPENGRAK